MMIAPCSSAVGPAPPDLPVPVLSATDAYTAETLTITWHPKGITHEDIVMSSFYLEDIHTLPPTRTGVFVSKGPRSHTNRRSIDII